MDFSYSPEQEMLRDQVRSFLTERFAPERVAAIATEDAPRLEQAAWSDMADLGWVGLAAPESAGGSGMSFLDESVVFEEMGRALYPGPYLSSVGLALPALKQRPEAARSVVTGEVAATMAWAEPAGASSLVDPPLGTKAIEAGSDWRVTGTKELVPDLGWARLVVVSAAVGSGSALLLVDTDDAEVTVHSTMDSTRRMGTMQLNDSRADLLVGPDEYARTVEQIRDRALAALALESVGIASKMVELSVAHATEREQFGKPIGTYQAVSHQVADMFTDTELARSLAYWAAWSVAEDEGGELAAAAAKAFASEAAVRSCERAIQVHGGIGFTWEHAIHRYYRRAQWIESFEGHGSRHRDRVATTLLAD